jgi:hypothetical protein
MTALNISNLLESMLQRKITIKPSKNHSDLEFHFNPILDEGSHNKRRNFWQYSLHHSRDSIMQQDVIAYLEGKW